MSFKRFIPPDPGSLAISGDSTALTLTGSAGAVQLTPGSGSLVRRVARSITFDNMFADPTETFGMFVPGSPGAVALGTWKNSARNQAVYLRKFLANFRVAQTTADPANYYRLKVTDAAGAVAAIPMTAVTGVYLLDQGFGSVLDKGLQSYAGLGFSSAYNGPGYGWAFAFTVAATQTLTGFTDRQGLSIVVNNVGGGEVIQDIPVRVSILDASGYRLGGSSTAALPGNTRHAAVTHVPFDQSVTLLPGNTYYLALDIFGNYPGLGAGAGASAKQTMMYYISDTQTVQPNTGPLNFTGASFGAEYVAGNLSQATLVSEISALTWPNIFAGIGASTGVALTAPGGARAAAWELQGSPSGLAKLAGDLTFAIDTVGAPVATALGTDLNLSALISTT